MYANVHTATYPAGELRAQLTTTTEGQTDFLSSNLQGSQEVPPNASPGTGSVMVLLDKAIGTVYLTGSYSGLTSQPTASHIHRAPPGVNGPIITELSLSGDSTFGTITGTDTLASTDVTEMINGNTYANIHTDSLPAGELRGQLISSLQQLHFLHGTLQSSQEVPPNSSLGGGTVIVRYNSNTKILELWGDYQNLTSPITGSHIHQAPPDSSGPIIIELTNSGDTTGTLRVTDTLTPEQETELLAGNMYANVHTTNFPAGELRAQLTTTTEGQTDLLSGTLQGSQEVPPNVSAGTGSVMVLLDKGTNAVYLTGSYTGLSSPPTASHIHRAPPGVNGDIIAELSVSGDTASGTITGTDTLAASDVTEMVNGNTYVNIHSTLSPAGELRAQLGDVVLPVKLLYFNGYKEQNKIVLMWESAQETNLSHYEVEQQSLQTRQWITKAIIEGTKTSNGAKYSYNDLPIISNEEYIIYRLKMIDLDGKFSYSSVVRVNYKQSAIKLAILTNPVVNNQLQFIVTGLASDTKMDVTIIDYNGRILSKSTASSLMNNTVPLGNVSPGIYKLIVRVNGTIMQQSFMK